MYLIGGAPRLGKSILSKKLLDARGIPVFSTDALCAAHGADFQFVDVMHLPTEDIVRKQIAEARDVAATIEYFVGDKLNNPGDFTLEGVHLLPSFVRRVQDGRSADVRSIFVIATDKTLVLSGLRSDAREDNWMRGAPEKMQNAMADFVVAFSTEIRSQAEKEGLRVFERTVEFWKDIGAMLRLLQ